MDMQSFFQNPIVNAISFGIGILGTIIGLISGFITYKGFRGQKNMEYGYMSILEQAKRDWKGRYTENQINDLTVQFRNLEEQIRNEIPQQVRKTLLENQLNTICISIGDLYNQYKTIKNEIYLASTSEVLDESIKGIIDSDIMPIYKNKQKQNRNLYNLVLFILIFTVAPFILRLFDFSLDNLILNFSLYIFGLILLINVIKPLKLKRVDNFLLKGKKISWFLLILLVLLWIGSIYIVIIEPNHLNLTGEVFVSALSYIPYSISLYIYLNFRIKYKSKYPSI
ncbi:hypothetical protein G9F71_012415 [Clostridium sp. FP2]|uniref:hypothetical protein n=1 Tax=Clostridium sp. FP2 TaxID=2724481 RepID=UPI0013E97028|nr:hypothetical protein [Clostridium sp. FP2]MBZ9623655.1 hypothetical protein [Clostridium sp. FP2]